MRKKLSSILIGILLVFAGVFASACGDKYKNFEFKVSYAFSKDSNIWYDADEGISLNYSVDDKGTATETDDEYVFDINGREERVLKNNFNLYIKVKIDNVEAEYIDSITISAEGSNGLAFESSTIREGKTVKLGIVGVVNSQLSLYENESGKSKKINLSIYGKLEDLDFNENLTPAVVVGETINLNSISNLIYYNKDKGATTNQTGVEYSVVDFGYFIDDDGTYISNSTTYNKFTSLTNGRLRLNKRFGAQEFELSSSNNVIHVLATSIYNPEIKTDVYVYIVPDDLAAPSVTYVDGAKAGVSLNDDELLYKGLDLYLSADTSAYSTSKVNLSSVENLYTLNNIYTHSGKKISLKPYVYVGNSDAYNFDVVGNPVRNLLIEENESEYTIKLVNRSTEAQVDVKFAYKIVAVDDVVEDVVFTSGYPELYTTINVRKHVLASSILANGEELENGDEISGEVLSTSNSNYLGYELELGIDPIDQFALEKQAIEITGIDNLIVKDENNFEVISGTKLDSFKTLFFKFKPSINAAQTITFKTKKSPYYFNGNLINSPEYIEITLNLIKKVTADDLEIVDGESFNAVSSVKVAANKESCVFVKAYHTGALNLETITAVSSSFALNNNGDKQILLQNTEFVSSGEGYSIYKINLPATQKLETSTLTVYAGELGKGAAVSVTMEAVNLITDADNISIVPKETTYVEDLGNNKFAVVKDKEIQFNVVEVLDGENLHNTVKVVSLPSVTIDDLHFGDSKTLKANVVLNSNIFKVQGWQNKTRVLDVKVEYYDQIDGVITLTQKTIEDVQFAVYNPITSVVASIQKEADGKTVKDSVVYVNNNFLPAALTEIYYGAYYGSTEDMPTQAIYFVDNGIVKEQNNVAGVQISMDEDLSDVSAVKLWYLLNSSFSLLDNQKMLVSEANINSTVRLQLVSSYAGRLGVTFSFTAKQFGKTTSVRDTATIYFKSVDLANGLDIKGKIHQYSSTDRELQLSFMGVQANEVSKSFTATPTYSNENVLNEDFKRFTDIDYLLYKYTLQNGEVVYESDGKTPKLTPITSISKSLKVAIDGNTVTVTADKTLENIGGLYKLVIGTMDSHNDANGTFGTTYSLNVRVSDGKSVNSAYVITDDKQLLGINNDLNAHYILGNIITIKSDDLTIPIGYNKTESGTIVESFKGSLSGKLHTITESGVSNISSFSIYVTINSKIDVETYGYLYGLFSILEGKISNLNIHISMNVSTPEELIANIGGVVGVNKGTIENVSVYLSGAVTINATQKSNFGGIAAVNEGEIKNCKVDSSNGSLSITSSIATNIGLVAGENNGEITGKYQGKDSLEQVSYDVIANLIVNNKKDNVPYNIGTVAGYSTSNISNILVGGRINVTSKNDSNVSVPMSGYLAGIVGETSADLLTVAALGLNLNNTDNSGIKLAGIAGVADEITDARYISAAVSFKFGKCIGQIVGKEVAGIAFDAKVTYSTVESFIKTVDDAIFYTVEADTKAYGLINLGSATNSFVTANIKATNVYLTSNVLDASKNLYTYFIGYANGTRTANSTYSVVYNDDGFVEVMGFTNNDPTSFIKEYKEFDDALADYLTLFEGESDDIISYLSDPTTYVVFGYDDLGEEYTKLEPGDPILDFSTFYLLESTSIEGVLYYFDGDSYEEVIFEEIDSSMLNTTLYTKTPSKYFDMEAWEDNIDDLAGFEVDSDYNKISGIKDYESFVWYFPYLLDAEGNKLMILQPTYIEAEINKDYQISTEQNIYVDDVEIKDDATPPTYTISESIIVDFFSFTSLFENHTDANKHLLVSPRCATCVIGETKHADCYKGLLNLTMLPVTAGLNFEIIDNGVDYAQIIDNTHILFTGASNGEPIVVKVYSVFNADVKVYVAFYSQQTYSKITLNGSNITESAEEGADFILKSYQGKTGNLITLSGENIINGNKFESIFEKSDVKKYIKIQPIYDTNVLNVSADTLSTISVAIRNDYTITTNGEAKNVTFKVWLDKSYFGDSVRDTDLLLGEVTLKVLMYNIAEGLEIIGADTFEIDSASSVSLQASLKTGLVDLNDSRVNEEQLRVISQDGVIIVEDVDSSVVKDSIKMTIASTSPEISNLLDATDEDYIVDLFDFDVYSIRTNDGYKYFITLCLKDKFKYRYITSNINLELQIWADSDDSIQNSAEIRVKPTTVNTTRFANYAVEKIATVSDTKSELTIGNVETSIISPGGRGNILVAYAEPSYSNIDSISITSSELFVPSLGRNVNLIFSQLVYNETTGKFETLFNANLTEQNGNTLQLQKVTQINEYGEEEYTGLLYIHVQLVKFAGLESTITASLNVTSNGKELAKTTKTFTTTFLPGADLYYTGRTIADGYLIQEETYQNTAKIKLQGYQFNSNPIMNINWEIADGVDYFYDIDNVLNNTISDPEIIKTTFEKDNLYYKESGKYYKAKTESDCYKADVTFYSITNKKTIVIGGTDYVITDYVSYYFEKDYTEVTYNSVDGSYTMDVKFNIAKDIPTNFSMFASLNLITKDGQFESAKSDTLKFYPTKYVITDISVANTSGNKKMLAINRTDKFEILFATQRSDYDYSNAIYTDEFIAETAGNGKINEDDLTSLFSYYDQTRKTFADSSDKFSVAIREKYLTVTGTSKFESTVTLSVYIGYKLVNGKYDVVFGEVGGEGLTEYRYSFVLQIYPGAGEENATPIYYDYEMFDSDGNCLLAENGHYILMNDITLDQVKPIDYAIGSLDGNNKIIKIKNFVVDTAKTHYGLFANIGTYIDEEQRSHKTILKNVIVDYSEFNTENNGNLELLDEKITNVVFGGLVAENRGGLIYNSDVINYRSSSTKIINLLVNDNAKLTFGGFVGINSGNITNSRVGRSTFTRIDAINDRTTNNIPMGSLTFVLGNENLSGFDVVSAGFVGVNSGKISSSYFANSSLVNYSNSKDENLTAGFVGSNNAGGQIMYSYVKAMEDTISPTVPYATGAKIEGKGNTIVAGFVYENGGKINDCYSNTMLRTNATYMAGFVYNNSTKTSSGTISECYAACSMKAEGAQDDAEQPFVGKNNEGVYLDSGIIENAYYLISDSGSGEAGSASAQALNATNFKNSNNLSGFVFVQSNVKAEREQGVWSHINTKGYSVILPELMNANSIAHSAKYLLSGNGIEEKFTYTNASSYLEGSQNNPFIIRNIEEFNDVFTGNRTDLSTEISKSGYVRLIDNIDFGEDETAIKTRVKYTLGDANKANITSFEGNGMSINGIYFDVSEPGISELGLFAKIRNAYIKNVNLNFVKPKTGGQYSTTLVKYSGGLAGIISNSAIINVSLNGSNVSLTGQNFVGGLAGLVEGSSLLYGITSNLSAVANYNGSNLYYSKEDYVALGNNAASYNSYVSNLSYAGGLAGVIDLTRRANTDYNIAYIDILGNEMFKKTGEHNVQLANISGQYAGGIAGFASKYATGLKLKYHVGSTDWISGTVAAGGLFGVSLGSITASQVTADEDIQYNYDTKFGDYIININSKTLDQTAVGNLNLVESANYAGGLIGIGVNASINASYSKAGIKDGVIIGGLIGASIASNVTYSYAVPFVNVTDNNKYIGGLIGSAYMVNKGYNSAQNSAIKKYEDLVNLYLKKDSSSPSVIYTDIQYTFSTVIMDKTSLVEQALTWTATDKTAINYIAPSFTNNENVDNIRSGGQTTYTGVYAGTVDYSYSLPVGGEANQNPVSTIDVKAKNRDLDVLYNLKDSLHESTFNEIFLPWATMPYWSIRHEKYFPLLTNDGVDNYIILDDKDDLSKITSNPDGKFLVVEDIPVDAKDSNWFFDCEFTGELLGQVDPDTDEKKKITGIALNPNTPEDSSGLFRKTRGAVVSNLDFVWQDGGDGAINTCVNGIKELTSVAGLSCDDAPDNDGNCSEFNNVEVRVAGNGYLFKQPDVTINTFAGLIASTESSSINNCSFAGKAQVSLGTVKDDAVYFGGLVAKAAKSANLQDSNMSIMNSKLGANGEDTNITTSAFEIEIADGDTTQAYIGGLVGQIDNGSLYSSTIGGVNYQTGYQNISFDITLSSDSLSSVDVGGLIGYSRDSAVTYCDVNSILTVSGTSSLASARIGGLIAEFVSASNIMNLTNAKVDIDITELNVNNILASSGVAWLNSSNPDAAINQCLITGSIIAEDEDDETKILQANTIVYGAVVATAKGQAKIAETISTAEAIIGTNQAANHTVKAGGFVGYIDAGSTLTIENCASAGKLVPICGEAATGVHLGAMIGSVDDSSIAIIKNSYTLTSVIADAISGQTLDDTNSDALVGYANENVTVDDNVYFSTDITLTTNDKNLGTNLNAVNLVGGETDCWKADFVNSAWKLPEVSEQRVPFIKALEDNLKKYGVLNLDDTSHKFDYVLGKVMRPQENPTAFESGFTYYIVSGDKNSNISGTLNGVLIGNDSSIKYTSASVGYITTVTKHSAVSNLHFELVTGTNYALGGTAVYDGIIVETNNGLMFNCSVQGKEIKLTINQVGLIAGQNSGTISYCYSTAEISDPSGSTAGIVYENNGVINTCYFTGYIDNSRSNSSSAGIMVVAQTNSYVYNTYMAGVIEKINDGKNSFSASNNDLIGLNNYIDQYANIETVEQKDVGNNIVLKSVQTANLMAKAALSGNWYFTVTAGAIDTSAESFGLNYGYPIYKFNKQKLNSTGTDLACSDLDYSLNTGKGLNPDGEAFASDATLESRYNALITADGINPNAYYEAAYKIPHLGVLSVVHGLLGTSRNYVVIYDIDGKMTNWTAVGSNGNAQGFNYVAGFNGVFVTNKYLTNSSDGTDVEVCSIQGLNKDGLFDQIQNAYFANIVLGSFGKLEEGNDGLKDSGPLGKTVTGKTVVNSISYADNSIIEGTNVSALFGDINIDTTLATSAIAATDADVTIAYFNTLNSAGTYHSVTMQGNGSAGLIAYKVSAGNLELISGTNELYPFAKKFTTFGGLVGNMIGGKILGNSHAVNLNLNTTDTITNLGGLVGKASGGEIDDAIVRFYSSDTVISANAFGGFVSIVQGSATFNNCSITSNDAEIEFKSVEAGNNGLVAGVVKPLDGGGLSTITINNFNMTGVSKLELTAGTSSEDNSSIGGIVGCLEGDLTFNFTSAEALTIETPKIVNLGGIVGLYKGGNINVYKLSGTASTAEASGSLTLKGYQNVGGFVGKVEKFPTITKPEGQTEEPINFLEHGAYAEIVITEKSHSNFGGIFGLLTSTNKLLSSTPDDGATTLAEEITSNDFYKVVNNNVFTFEEITDPSITEKDVINIGGVVGKIEGSDDVNTLEIGNLSNTIKFEVTESKYFIRNLGGVIGQFKGTLLLALTNTGEGITLTDAVKEYAISNANSRGDVTKPYSTLMNVGGIVGLIVADEDSDDIKVSKLTNETVVQGYQNVGGLIGYASGIELTGDITISYAENITLNNSGVLQNATLNTASTSGDVAGVINVGGVIGYAEKSTIQNIFASSKTSGNVNVGGLIGLSNKNEAVQNNYVGHESDQKEIKGIYYNYYFINDAGNIDHVSYIPTSVGGLIGTSVETTICSSVVGNVKITSTKEGEETGSTNAESKGMISTIKNYMVKMVSGAGSDELGDIAKPSDKYTLGGNGRNERKVKYNEIQSGFGGFVGTIGEIGFVDSSKPSYMKNISIDAPIGINVGTYYGIFVYDENFKAPVLYGNVEINGGYNVGGIAGKVSGTINAISNENLLGTGKIMIQTDLTGMFIGGLFGEVQSNDVEGLTINNASASVDIQITTIHSYYIGGLVGKLHINANNTFNGIIPKDETLVVGSDANNFGGLVGMLKCDSYSNLTYSVNGEHYYPFTVNTIENQNYAEGKSQFGTNEIDNDLYLSAQAYYINEDSFNISASSDGSLYNNASARNPLRTDSKGWAKDYTGFKQIQRCIPQADNNGADWDSISFVYNAQWIKNVGTIQNLGLADEFTEDADNGDDNTSTKYYFNTGTADGKLYYRDLQHIVYTVYEKNADTPILYTASGIASAIDASSVQDLIDYHNKLAKNNLWHLGGGSRDNEGYPNQMSGGSTVPDADITVSPSDHIEELNSMDLVYFNWSNDNKNDNNDNTRTIRIDLGNCDNGWTNFWNDLWHGKDSYDKFATKLCYIIIDGVYYNFDVIYANNSIPENANRDSTATAISSSGSVLEVCGLKPYFKYALNDEGGMRDWFVPIATAIIAVVGVVLGIVSGGIGFTLTYFAIAGVAGIAAAIQLRPLIGQIGKQVSYGVYYSTTNQHFGLLTSSTTTEIRYSNGKMKGSVIADIYVQDADESYHQYCYYSTERPSDFYSSYYINLKKEGDDFTSIMDLNGSSLAIPIAYNDEDINIIQVPNTEKYNEYGFRYEGATKKELGLPNGVNAFRKYIYHEGSYYCHALSLNYDIYQTQELSNMDGLELESYETYIAPSGLTYVRGNYDPATGIYSFKNETDNNVEYSNGSYTLNGASLTTDAYVEATDISFYLVGDSGTGDGYSTLTGAYYTAVNTGNSDFKYANFEEYAGTIGSGWQQNIDYITRTYYVVAADDGGKFGYDDENDTYFRIPDEDLADYAEQKFTITSTTKNYIMKGSSNATSETNFGTMSNPLSSAPGGAIVVKVYPYSLYSPLHETNSFAEDVRDEKLYGIESLVDAPYSTNYPIKSKITYFYFDGGYKMGADIGMTGDFANAVYTDYTDTFTKLSTYGETLKVYNASGGVVGISPADLYDKSYEGTYYTQDITKLTDAAEKAKADVIYCYVKYGGKYYKRLDEFMLDTQGRVNKISTYIDADLYIKNRYRTHSTNPDLYTMFRYTETGTPLTFSYSSGSSHWFDEYTVTDGDGETQTKYKWYYVIPNHPNATRPNAKPTYLVESCKVTLGGGYSLPHTGLGTKTSGTITISSYLPES